LAFLVCRPDLLARPSQKAAKISSNFSQSERQPQNSARNAGHNRVLYFAIGTVRSASILGFQPRCEAIVTQDPDECDELMAHRFASLPFVASQGAQCSHGSSHPAKKAIADLARHSGFVLGGLHHTHESLVNKLRDPRVCSAIPDRIDTTWGA